MCFLDIPPPVGGVVVKVIVDFSKRSPSPQSSPPAEQEFAYLCSADNLAGSPKHITLGLLQHPAQERGRFLFTPALWRLQTLGGPCPRERGVSVARRVNRRFECACIIDRLVKRSHVLLRFGRAFKARNMKKRITFVDQGKIVLTDDAAVRGRAHKLTVMAKRIGNNTQHVMLAHTAAGARLQLLPRAMTGSGKATALREGGNIRSAR